MRSAGKLLTIVGALAVLVISSARAQAAELTVAAAADLQYALREIAENFQRQTGHSVRLSFGSSGNLYAQALQGAPYDLFFSADQRYPRLLVEAGRAHAGSLRVYGTGRLVLWVRERSLLQAESAGLKALLAPGVRRVAIANPRHAPYGRAAVEALKHYRIYEQLEQRLIFGEQVSQAAQFVDSGNADAGLIALSLALSPTMQGGGRYWLVPEEAHAPLLQAAVIPAGARNPELAREFLNFVLGEGAPVLRRYGFTPPEGAP